MILHRPLDLTTIPTEVAGAQAEHSRFSASWSATCRELQLEANHVAGRPGLHGQRGVDVYVEVDLPPSAIRNDGGIRANARPPTSQVVAVTVPHRELGELRLVSGRYKGSGYGGYLPGWQANVRAVALTLKALRDVDRWGAASGEQYRGFAAIGATSTGTALGAGMTRADATQILATATGDEHYRLVTPGEVADADLAARMYRAAARRHHPDHGGDPALFAEITRARDLLVGGAR